MDAMPTQKTATRTPARKPSVPVARTGPTKREKIAAMITDAAPTGGVSFNRIANALGGNRTQVHDMIKLMIANGTVKRVGEGSQARLLPVE